MTALSMHAAVLAGGLRTPLRSTVAAPTRDDGIEHTCCGAGWLEHTPLRGMSFCARTIVWLLAGVRSVFLAVARVHTHPSEYTVL